MKYFTYSERPGLLEIECFTETSGIDHLSRAKLLGVLDKIESAGFLHIVNGQVECSGYSKSLTEELGRDISSKGQVDATLFMFHNKISLKMR